MPQIPLHEQHYPSKLLPHRLEEYVLDDGLPTQNRMFAKKVTGKQVVEAVKTAQELTGIKTIDDHYFVGTCFHEAGCSNEWDTEVASPTCVTGFQSVGAYQIGQEEAAHYGFKLSDMLDFVKATTCMIKLAENNRARIRIAAKLGNGDPDPDYIDAAGHVWVGGAMRAYLAICHNHGVGYVQATITKYGLNWDAYKTRNPTDPIVSHKYGEDCITGGDSYPDYDDAKLPSLGHRTLKLTNPFMTGDDVMDLQRHLKVTPDGTFGPQTEAALKAFQKSHGLDDDGICGGASWPLLLQQ